MNEQLLSGADVLSSRKKLKKLYGRRGGEGGGCIHHPLLRPSVKIMWVMSLVGYDRSVASSSTYVVGLAYFHFHIS